MTRFEMEINGIIDARIRGNGNGLPADFWKKNAEKDVARVVEYYKDGKLIIDAHGVASWASNGNAVPEDIAQMAQYGGLPIDIEATANFREMQNAYFMENYRRSQVDRKYTEEELGEMRNVFGEGAVVVDAITGQRIEL